MAITTVRSTYALDVETMRRIDNLARRWDVAKSEVIRRAVRMADEQAGGNEGLEALDALQAALGLTRSRATAWASEARHERHASADRRERRG